MEAKKDTTKEPFFFVHIGKVEQFNDSLDKWFKYSKTTNGPMIYVGVPSHEAAAISPDYWRTPAEMAIIYDVSSRVLDLLEILLAVQIDK